jgi:putative heme-binding domain-containing protein
MQLAYSLGQWQDRQAGQALAQLAGRDARDPFMEAAITSSAVYNAGVILESLLRQDQLHGGLTRLISNLLRQAHESGEEGVLVAGLDRVIDEHRASVEAWQFEVIADFLEGADFQFSSFEELHQASSPRMEKTLRRLLAVLASARDVVGDGERDVELRTHAARLLGRERDRLREDLAELGKLLTPQVAAALQNAAIETLSRCNHSALPEVVLRDWPQLSPAVRSRVLDLLVSRKDWTTKLLDSIAKGRPIAAEIGAVHRGKLLLHSSSEVRRRANEVLQVSRPVSRRAVIERYLAAADQADDMQRGRELFQQHCANCHVLEEKGVAVGPDLHTLTDYSTESLIVAVLDPNVALNPRYVEYSALTIDGRIVSGIVTDETGNSITLIGPEGNTHVLLRSDLDDFSSTGHSLMPDGMEQLIPEPRDLAALVHYVQEATKSPGKVAR